MIVLAAATSFAEWIDIQYGVVAEIKKSQTSGLLNTGMGAAAGGLVGGLLGATSSKANSSGEKRKRPGNPQQNPFRKINCATIAS